MTMADYNGFTDEERRHGDKIIKKAIKDGVLPPLNKVTCKICGQDKGVREYHAEDYSPEKIIEEELVLWQIAVVVLFFSF